MQNNKTKKKTQKGVAAIFITMMIMFVSLTMVLGLTVIFVGHLRILRGMGNSVVAFYAANSGIERLLYEDKKCWISPCPAHCVTGCAGLISGSSFSATLTNGATYRATFSTSTIGGIVVEHFESIGTFEDARRAIRATR
jgi:hypothetical protein